MCRHRMLRQRVDKYARIRVKLQGLRRLTTHDSCGSFSDRPVRRGAPSLYCNQPAPRSTLLREGRDIMRCRTGCAAVMKAGRTPDLDPSSVLFQHFILDPFGPMPHTEQSHIADLSAEVVFD